MKKIDLEIGMRVEAIKAFAGYDSLRGKTGIVIHLEEDWAGEYLVGVEFDEPFEGGHACKGQGRSGHCRYGSSDELAPIVELKIPDTFSITYDDLIEGGNMS